jgi:hypothetical protein
MLPERTVAQAYRDCGSNLQSLLRISPTSSDSSTNLLLESFLANGDTERGSSSPGGLDAEAQTQQTASPRRRFLLGKCSEHTV